MMRETKNLSRIRESFSRQSRRNSLIRRIQRHAQVSALFGGAPGSIEEAGAGEGFLPVQMARRSTWGLPFPVVTASLSLTPAPGEVEAEAFGEGEVTPTELPTLTGEGGELLPAEKPQSQMQETSPGGVEGRRAPQQAQPEPPRPAGRAVSRQPKPPAPRPAESFRPLVRGKGEMPAETPPRRQAPGQASAEPEGSPQTEDRIWKRLQTIFRKHEEKRRAEQGLTVSDSEAEALVEQTLRPQQGAEQAGDQPVSPIPPPSASVGYEKTEPAAPVTGAEVGLQKDVPAEEPPRDEMEKGASLPPKPLEQEETRREAGLAGDRVVEIEQSELLPELISEPPVAEKAMLKREEARTEAEGAPGKETQAADQVLSKPPVSRGTVNEPPLPKPPAVLEATPEEQQATQVLQPVPLEEVWHVQRQVPQPKEQKSRGEPSVEEPTEILDQEEYAQVREALQEVLPGQPTDSPVEVITPRRPRPKPAEAKEQPSFSPPQSDQSSAKPEESEVEAPTGIATEQEAELIETGLGPLPADLWELIGESPPPTQPRSKQTSAPTVLEASDTPEQGDSGSKPGMREAAPGMVQRQLAEPPPVESQAGEAAAEGGLATKPTPELDMDELAARVYGEVKRRLALEWERLRRRF